jgi:hypothetical protein
MHILGAPGAGKTILIFRTIAFRDSWRRIPLIGWDLTGSGIDYFLQKVLNQPAPIRREMLSRIRYIDMGSKEYVYPFPAYLPLADDDSLYEISQRILDVFKKSDPFLEVASIEGWNALWLTGTFTGLIIAALGLQITEAERLVRDPLAWERQFRKALEKHPQELQSAVAFFRGVEKLSPGAWRRQTGSFLTKVTPFSLDPTLIAMFGASEAGVDWDEVVREGLTVLIDFRNVHDSQRRRFLMWWVFQSIINYIKHRGHGRHAPISFVIDELSSLLSDTLSGEVFADATNELVARLSRQMRVWLTIAGQELFQYTETLQKTLLLMGSQCVGRVSDHGSAKLLAEKLLNYNPELVKWWKTEWMVPPGMYGSGWPPVAWDSNPLAFLTLEEQLRLLVEKFMRLHQFEFLAHIARGEGDIGGELNKMTIGGLDFGLYPDAELVACTRAWLLERDGTPVAEVMAAVHKRLKSEPATTVTLDHLASLPDGEPVSQEAPPIRAWDMLDLKYMEFVVPKLLSEPLPNSRQAKRGLAFQVRDGLVLLFIHHWGNRHVSKQHIKNMPAENETLTWKNRTMRACEMRLSALRDQGYITLWKVGGRILVLLGWRGALWVAAQEGIHVEPPANTGENQLRQLERRLREKGFRWLRKPPNVLKVPHDLAALDFLLAVKRAVEAMPRLVLEEVIQEHVFRSEKDVVEFVPKRHSGEQTAVQREVYPDLFLSIVDRARLTKKGEPWRYRVMLEVDFASHSGPSFAEKAQAMAHYVGESASYKKRFGHNGGRILVVTTGKTRMKNMMKQTRKATGSAARMFWFTTLPAALKTANLLGNAIWLRGNWKRDEPGPLFSSSSQ